MLLKQSLLVVSFSRLFNRCLAVEYVRCIIFEVVFVDHVEGDLGLRAVESVFSLLVNDRHEFVLLFLCAGLLLGDVPINKLDALHGVEGKQVPNADELERREIFFKQEQVEHELF